MSDALIEMLNEFIVNGYRITVEAQGRNAQGRIALSVT